MDSVNDPVEITCEFLQKHMERAAYCTSATLPADEHFTRVLRTLSDCFQQITDLGDEFREILKLATRRKTFAVLGLHHLLQMRDRDEVTLLGHELRSLLVLASKAHPRQRRRKIRVALLATREQDR